MKDSNKIGIRITIVPPKSFVTETAAFEYTRLMDEVMDERLNRLTCTIFKIKSDNMATGYIRYVSTTTTIGVSEQPTDSAIWAIVANILGTMSDTATGKGYRIIIEYWWPGNDSKHVLSGTGHQLTKTNPKFSLRLKPITKKDKELM